MVILAGNPSIWEAVARGLPLPDQSSDFPILNQRKEKLPYVEWGGTDLYRILALGCCGLKVMANLGYIKHVVLCNTFHFFNEKKKSISRDQRDGLAAKSSS